jgi:hypothetical protein
MTLSDIIDVEEALTKTGPELFKELYRVYPVAEPEDYFKNGQWRNELMKADIVLLVSHRRESGAPDVPDIDDVKLPNLPEATSLPSFMPKAFGLGAISGLGAVSFQQGQQVAAKANTSVLPNTLSGAAAITAASTPVVEIRLIALFVAKWKLDPVKSKTELSKLTPARRRYIIQNFKATSVGPEATKELETYLAECEADGSWDKAPANGAADGVKPAGVQPAATIPKPAGIPATAPGLVKRPLTPNSVVVPAKFPKSQ